MFEQEPLRLGVFAREIQKRIYNHLHYAARWGIVKRASMILPRR